MYWHTGISWIICNSSLYNTAKGSCKTGWKSITQNITGVYFVQKGRDDHGDD